MSLNDLASIGSFVSGVGVVISLLYLSWQIQQNTRHTRALIHQGRVNRAVDLSWRWVEKDWDAGFSSCSAGYPDAKPDDIAKYLLAVRSMFVSYEDTYIQHNEGLMEGDAFRDAESMIRRSMRSRGNRIAWEVLRSNFASGYQAYIDRLIAETAMDDAHNNDTVLWRAAALRIGKSTA